MILDFPRGHPPDEAERRVCDVAAARAWLGEQAAPLQALIERRRAQWQTLAGGADDLLLIERTADALRLACARLALRHGRLGADFHAYHNEGHILEICAGRIDRLVEARGLDALSLRDWCALTLFGGGHDLRQREAPDLVDGVGANERASVEEMQRILDVAGFTREREPDLYVAIELMIAGSTFDARVLPGGLAWNAADLVHNGGALADQLVHVLDRRRPGWRHDPDIAHAQQLALIAADLDTANVADPFAQFAATAENLCREREMLAGRSLAAGESALPVLAFLTEGQERFFFELHRFQSALGRSAFAAAKEANAGRVRALCDGLRAHVARLGTPATGEDVLAAYRLTLSRLCP